jgi:hypothetical protein
MSNQLAASVQDVVKEAIERVGKAHALALQIHSVLGRTYNHRTVSAWARGDAMPPGDALMAAAKVARVSLDARLMDKSLEPGEQLKAIQEELADQRKLMAQLEERLRSLSEANTPDPS